MMRQLGHLGRFGLAWSDGGAASGPGLALSAPTFVLTSDPGRTPITWNTVVGADIYAGYIYRLQVAADLAFTSIEQDIYHDIKDDELDTGDFNVTADGFAQPATGTSKYFRARYERDDGAISNWTTPVLVSVLDFTPTAFSFTDQTALDVSTLVYSNSITVLGVSAAAVCNWSLTGSGFEAQVNGAGAWATSGTCVLNDTIQLRGTTSGSGDTQLSGVLTIEGVSDTWSITTESALPLPQPSALAIFCDVSDLSNLWQTITGTTAVASDGDVVGTWKDRTANGRNVTAVANDTTRPVYRAGGGHPYVEFDGSNDILRFLGDLGLWNPSGYTAAIAYRSASNAANKMLMGVGGTSSTNQVISLHSVLSNADNVTGWIRNDSGIDVMSNSVAIAGSAFDETDRVMIVVDNGSSVQIYLDGVAGTPRNYTRGSNSLTLNTFSVGGRHGGGSSGLFFAARVHAFAYWPGINLNSTERAQVLTTFGATQGRTL